MSMHSETETRDEREPYTAVAAERVRQQPNTRLTQVSSANVVTYRGFQSAKSRPRYREQ